MSYQTEREDFIVRMEREGLPLHVTRALLRGATTIQRYAELACSSEAADRDRVPCPASQSFRPRRNGSSEAQHPCLCDRPNDGHDTIPRITLQEHRLTVRLTAQMPDGWTLRTDGDPRGYTLRVIPPSYAERNKGRDRFNQDTIGVPSGPTRLRF